MRSTLVLGMGNPILSDDSVGLVIAQRLRATPMPGGVEIGESEVAGLRLLELMRGYARVIIVDAIAPGSQPGAVTRLDAKDFKGGQRYGSAHSLGLATILEIGETLDCDMPQEVVVFAIEAVDVETFSEELTPPVAAAVDRVVALVQAELEADAA